MTIRIVVADDQALVRGAIAMMLDLEEDIDVVAQAGNGREAIEAVARGGVDVVLADVEMPVMDGIAAASRIRKEHPDVKILMVTTFGRPGYLRRAMEAGASGFVVKDAPASELAESVRRVHAGLRVVDPALAADSLVFGDSPLTARETEVLQAAADGATVSEVARRVHLSEGTTRNHLSQAMAKTGAPTRAAAVHIAAQKGWIIE